MPQLCFDIPHTLARQVRERAEAAGLSLPDYVTELIRRAAGSAAPEDYVERIAGSRQAAKHVRPINRGDIYWVTLANLGDQEFAIPHPYVVVQEDLFNHSRIPTVVACALTSNLRRTGDTPGNVLLEPGEANLPRPSVVEVSKVTTVDKAQLGQYIGSLSEQRIHQILAGIRFLQTALNGR
jgi:mRNA interferase MazF